MHNRIWVFFIRIYSNMEDHFDAITQLREVTYVFCLRQRQASIRVRTVIPNSRWTAQLESYHLW